MRLAELLESVTIKPGTKYKDRTYFQHTVTGSTAELVDQGEFKLVTVVETPDDTRGRGGARELMAEITRYADEHGFKLRLNVLPDEDTDFDRLVSLYRKCGFEKTTWPEMVRLPKGK